MMMWTFVALVASVYCGIQTFRDARRKQYAMAAFGAAVIVAILTVPIETHAVKVELPMR